MLRRGQGVALAVFLAWAGIPCSWGVVISEIHYHPPQGEEGLEFVELTNETTTPEDISGYVFLEGISFVFPGATILRPGASLVVCADVDLVKGHYGIENAVGNFSGKLDSSGERITLANHSGVVVQGVRYRDRGKWSAAPDGTGHSLILKDLHLDPSEPESWTQSPDLGGSPGRANFPETADFVETVVVPRGAIWRYAKGTQAFSSPETAWRERDFDDSAWLTGSSGFGYGDNDDATVLADMQNAYTSVACRIHFETAREKLTAPGDFFVAVDYDDGFIAYLNGTEIARANAGTAGVDLAWDAVATGSREAWAEELFPSAKAAFREGDNVLAVVGFNFSVGSTDFSLIPRVLHRAPLGGSSPSERLVSFNELLRSSIPGQSWVELYNASSLPFDLAGCRLTDDPARADPYVFPPGSVIDGRSFLVLAESAASLNLSAPEIHLFLLAPAGTVLTASAFDRQPPAGAPGAGYAEARYPDGGPLDWVTSQPTPSDPNQVDGADGVVMNEILYHHPDDPLVEYVELHNRGDETVNLSGFHFTKGIDYTFGDEVLAPGAYLVVALDPVRILDRYGPVRVVGPYTGRLSNQGENLQLVDASGNPVDDVRYSDGGDWSQWADGGGSSLELVDPWQDNDIGTAWEASDETEKVEWEQLSFAVADYLPATESELHLYLAQRGACFIDDVSITRSGGANLIPNPGFEVSTAPWVIQGTHIRSNRITSDAHSGSACLELIASGRGDTTVNRIEIETNPKMTRGPYDVSLWARWRRGSNLLLLHGEFTAGAYGGRPSPAINLSGNSLAARLRMTLPRNIGTPGAENSARIKLRSATGSDNLGPVIASVSHSPPSPSQAQQVTVSALVKDYSGVASVQAHYRQSSALGTFTTVPLFDDGLHADGEAADSLYAGQLPAFNSGTKVVYFLECVDSLGAVRRYPVEAPERTHLYQVQGPLGAGLDAWRLVLDDARTGELQGRPLHSNDLLDAAFVFNDDQVYENVGVRYRGSPWGRPGRNSFRARFQEDKPFYRGFRAVNLSSRGGAPNEGAAYFLVGRSGSMSKPAAASDYMYVRSWLNGASLGMQSIIEVVDESYLDKWYGEGSVDVALKAVGRLSFDDGGNMNGWDGASWMYKDVNQENYRAYFKHSIDGNVDKWEDFVDFSRIADRTRTPDAAFDAQIDGVLDVEAFFRVLAPRILMADWDAFLIGNGHNGYLVHSVNDGAWRLLPFDMDNTFSNPAPALFPTSDPGAARLMGRPGPRRTYYRVLAEMVDSYWSSSKAGPFFDAVQSATGLGTGGIKSYLDTSGNNVRTSIRASTSVAFKITTNSGKDLTVDTTSVTLEGDAPVQVASLAFRINGGDLEALLPTWSTQTRWRSLFNLWVTDSVFDFYGIDGAGDIFASARIGVRSTAFSSSPDFVRGDVNRDGGIDISDALATLFYLFRGLDVACPDAADTDDDGRVDLGDAIASLNYLFLSGTAPRSPFPAPGQDLTPDALGCRA